MFKYLCIICKLCLKTIKKKCQKSYEHLFRDGISLFWSRSPQQSIPHHRPDSSSMIVTIPGWNNSSNRNFPAFSGGARQRQETSPGMTMTWLIFENVSSFTVAILASRAPWTLFRDPWYRRFVANFIKMKKAWDGSKGRGGGWSCYEYVCVCVCFSTCIPARFKGTFFGHEQMLWPASKSINRLEAGRFYSRGDFNLGRRRGNKQRRERVVRGEGLTVWWCGRNIQG